MKTQLRAGLFLMCGKGSDVVSLSVVLIYWPGNDTMIEAMKVCGE